MDLVRDLLDNRLVDRRARLMGRADGVILELRAGAAPRVTAVESGLTTLARRLHPRLVRWALRLERALGVPGGGAFRIPSERIVDIGIDVKLDVDADETTAYAWENWLRDHVIRHIPGNRI